VNATVTRWQQNLAARRIVRAITAIGLLWALVVSAPRLLAFPYAAQIGDKSVYSETPVAPEMAAILARSDRLLRESAIFADGYGKTIYLTNGGWRWRLLTGPWAWTAFGISRPITEAIVINRSDMVADKVFSTASNGRTRALSDTIAHEQAHGLLRSHFGFSSVMFQTWKIEGYCDYVAQAGSLDDAQAIALRKANPTHPALVYYDGRRRVTALLRQNGGSVDRLFRE
jgi:hypothetical protein